jgi:hypothetical protein
MTRHALAAAAALGLLASPVWAAEYAVKARAVCTDASGGMRLETVKGDNTNIISTCVGVADTDPSIALYAVTFDSTTRELHVVQRCDGAISCDLTDKITCQTAGINTKGVIDTRATCSYRILDIGMSSVEGTLLCRERELYSAATGKYAFHTSCAGNLAADTTPCWLGLTSGKPFVPDVTVMCPIP